MKMKIDLDPKPQRRPRFTEGAVQVLSQLVEVDNHCKAITDAYGITNYKIEKFGA